MQMARPKLEDRPSKVNRSDRPVRVPINGVRDKLTVIGKEAGFHYTWQPEELLQKFYDASYEHVTHDVRVGDKHINAASQIGGKVQYQSGGNGVVLYLLRVPQEYYDDDLSEYHRRVDRDEASMKESLNSKTDGRYGEVKIERGRIPE
jgi:hypothetical protein